MFNLFILQTKIVVGAIWLAFILGLFSLLPEGYNFICVMLGIALIIIHLIEYFVIKLKSDKEINFIQTMLFGYGHWLPIIRN